MAKHIIKQGKIVVVLSGRYAGKKAVVLKTFEAETEGKRVAKSGRKFPNAALICGLEKPPRGNTKATLKANAKLGESDERTKANAKAKKAMAVKTFVKVVNYTHLMPTRYNLELSDDLTKVAPEELDAVSRKTAADALKEKLEARYAALGGAKDIKAKATVASVYFFKKLKF